MEDKENPSDYAETRPSLLKKIETSLPPAAKTQREFWRGLKEFGIPLLLLLGAKWDIHPQAALAFFISCLIVLIGHYSLRKAEGMPDLDRLIDAFIKRLG